MAPHPASQPQEAPKIAGLVLAALLLWALIHAIHADQFIYHDSWKHIFPVVYRIAASGSCGDLSAWLGTVDNGSPTAAYALSMSLTHVLRVPTMYALSCLDLAPRDALYVHKLQIILSWLLFAGGMYVLGRVLYRSRASAAYLLVATLVSGAGLDALHSDQIVSELFWVPWVTAAFALFNRHRSDPRGALFFNAGVLFFSVSLLDHYPHLVALAAVIAGALYLALHARDTLAFFRGNVIRLLPGTAVMLMVLLQLLYVQSVISDYAPSLRGDLVVDPAKFGSTGFLQPTAVVTPFFPLTFLADYEKLFNTMPQYIFRLDNLLLAFGAIPLLLAMAAILSPRVPRAAKVGFGLFTLALALVALEQSRLYLLIFHLPFYDLFRGYFLFSIFIVFGILVLSGYGFDGLATSPTKEWVRLARSTVICGGATALVVVCGLAWLVWLAPDARSTVGRMFLPALFDVAALAIAAWVIAGARFRCDREKWIRCVILATALLQVPFFLGSYRMLAFSDNELIKTYRLDSEDLASRLSETTRQSGTSRKLCTLFAQCYLSGRPTVSFNLDLEGTFLRNRSEPVFQESLPYAMREALSGLSRPDVWLSRGFETYADRDELVQRLSDASRTPNEILDNTAFVPQASASQDIRQHATARRLGEIVRVERGPDRLTVAYRVDEPQVLVVAINYDQNWRARVEGRELPLLRANFGGMATPVASGAGTVELTYRSLRSELFFGSRYALLLAAAAVVGWLVRGLTTSART